MTTDMSADDWKIVEGVKEYLRDMLEARAEITKFNGAGSISCHVGYGVRAVEIFRYVRQELNKEKP